MDEDEMMNHNNVQFPRAKSDFVLSMLPYSSLSFKYLSCKKHTHSVPLHPQPTWESTGSTKQPLKIPGAVGVTRKSTHASYCRSWYAT